MFYSILPPILVVLSLVGVIIFLFKRASKVASLREEKGFSLESQNQKSGFFGRIVLFFKCSLCPKIGKWFGLFLEKIAEKTKKASSKLSGRITDVRTKRGVEEKDEVLDKVKKYDLKIFSRRKRNKEELIELEKEEKEIRPMISETVVSPRSKSEIKDMLEDVLIERIAVNPKDVEAYERLGEYYIEIGNYEHAKECVKQVIKLSPRNKDAKNKLRRLERIIYGQ